MFHLTLISFSWYTDFAIFTSNYRPKFYIGCNGKKPILSSKRIVVDINFLCDMVQLKYKNLFGFKSPLSRVLCRVIFQSIFHPETFLNQLNIIY